MLIGPSEAKPLSSGWCETGSFGTSHLVSICGAYVDYGPGEPIFV